MRSGLNLDNPVLAAAFRSALLHQGIVALLVFGILALTWVTIREWRPARAGSAGGAGSVRGMGLHTGMYAEPSWRTLLRVGFGLLWIFDGLLQAQPSMVVGLPSQVIQPTAASSPAWVQHLVNWAGTTWSYHPVQAAAAAVWIQAGIGCWLLSARHGRWSRLAGLAGLAWGLTVWVFGESFGGIFAPGLTWLFGAPGAALFYCAAGVLIALPVRYWRAPWLGRALLAVLGLFFTGMAVLQAWPGRGFWQGRLGHGPGTLTGMIQSMAQTPQPAFLAGWVGGFGSFTAAHGFAVNMFAVAALALIGALLIGAALPGGALPAGSVSSLRPGTPHGGTAQAGGQLLRQRGDDRALRRGPGSRARRWSRALLGRRLPLIRLAVIAAVLLCLADWVLIEDMGIFGGLGTDPNSMIPIALVLVAGYLAVAPAPAGATATEAAMAVGADASVAVRAERAIKRAAQVLAGAGAGANGAREAGAPELTGARAGANAAQEAGVPKLARAGAAADMIAGMAAAGTAAPAAKEQSGPEPATPQPTSPAPASQGPATPQPTSPAPASQGPATPQPTSPAPASQGPATPQPTSPAPASRGSAGTAPAAQEPAGRDPAAPEKPTVRVPARRKAWQAEGWRGRLSPARLAAAFGAADARTLAAAWALGVTILGAFPLAAAAANRSADPVIAEAIDGSAVTLNFPAPGFRLTDQNGKPVSLAGLRGKVVLLTFLDPVCTSDCPLIAQEFRAADQLLGAHRRGVVLVAVAANPVYHTKAYARAFDQQEGLAHLPNWKFLSGPLPALKRVWHDYYFSAQIVPAGGMLLHSDVAYVIDAAGRTRTELNFDPGPGTSASKSSFAAELSAAAVKAMRSS